MYLHITFFNLTILDFWRTDERVPLAYESARVNGPWGSGIRKCRWRMARAGIYLRTELPTYVVRKNVYCTACNRTSVTYNMYTGIVPYGMKQNLSYLKYVDTISTYRTPHECTEQARAGMVGTSMNASRSLRCLAQSPRKVYFIARQKGGAYQTLVKCTYRHRGMYLLSIH